jgi:large subunit ribosomal protein L10
MSKFVKQLVIDDLAKQFEGVQNMMLVGLTGIDANKTVALRANLAEKGIHLRVTKNSMAKRATKNSPLAVAFDGITGPCAACWGSADIVALAKELVKLTKDKSLQGFEIRGAVLDGEKLGSAQAMEVSKWPTREEQIAILLGQILGVGAKLSGQFISFGGKLASQIEKIAEKGDS